MAEEKRPRKRWKLVVGVIGGVVGLAVLTCVGFVLYAVFGYTPPQGDHYSAPTRNFTDQDTLAKGESVVQAYFDALMSHDAAAALAMLSEPPQDTTFLTDDQLTAALPPGTLSNLTYSQPDVMGSASVSFQVTYDLDGRDCSEYISVENPDYDFNAPSLEGRWQLSQGGYEYVKLYDIFQMTSKDFQYSLNGQTLGDNLSVLSDAIPLFPGVYVPGTTDPMLAYTGTYVAGTYDNSQQLVLTPQGLASVQAAAKAKLDGCLAQTVANPEDCGFGLGPGTLKDEKGNRITAKSVTWTTLDGLDAVGGDFSVYPSMTAQASGFSVHAEVLDTQGFTYSGNSSVLGIVVDISDPANLKVTFRSS